MTEDAGNGVQELHRPEVYDVLAAVRQQDLAADADIDRIEIKVLANGDVPYRLHIAGGNEFIGGFVRVGDTV